MQLNIKNEDAKLKVVVLGQPKSNGPVPTLSSTYDAKSYESVSLGIYPTERDIVSEMTEFERVLLKHQVQVIRPHVLQNCNQVFARDVAIVIDDKIINSNIIPDRENEKEVYQDVYNQISYNKIYNLPEKAHFEGGDIVLFNDYVFVGIYTGADYSKLRTARTNQYAFDFLKELFPHKKFISFELIKNDIDPRKGILHLDCTFMPLANNKLILYPKGFQNKSDVGLINELFKTENIFEISSDEMYHMNSNILSISPKIVVSDSHFERLNTYMESNWQLTVEKVSYREISKMGGLLRCSTLPLVRE